MSKLETIIICIEDVKTKESAKADLKARKLTDEEQAELLRAAFTKGDKPCVLNS